LIKVNIDADAFLWEFGSATDSEGRPVRWPFLQARIQGRIASIVQATGADTYQLYLTSTDKSNFRFELATIKPYKGNRSDVPIPFHYNRIRKFLIKNRGAKEVFGMEADDALSIASWDAYKESLRLSAKTGITVLPNVILASRDKDLDMVPGFHYSWQCGNQEEKSVWFQSELEGLKCFYKQLLTGDATDNIPGLYNVGKKSSLLKKIDACEELKSMFTLVHKQYKLRFGSYASMFLFENARLLHMLEYESEGWLPGLGWETSYYEEG
jgi:hypothetical protein